MQGLKEMLTAVFGSGGAEIDLTWYQTLARGAVIYIVGVLMLRLASRRLIGRRTPFDLVLTVILGAMFARGIDGAASMLATIATAFLLVLLDRGFAILAFHSEGFRHVVEGGSIRLIEGGEIVEENLRRTHVSAEELSRSLRRNLGDPRPDRAREAWLDPDGTISVTAG
jgi:uncharacterized membrane protein YcaP (DUF421 family)